MQRAAALAFSQAEPSCCTVLFTTRQHDHRSEQQAGDRDGLDLGDRFRDRAGARGGGAGRRQRPGSGQREAAQKRLAELVPGSRVDAAAADLSGAEGVADFVRQAEDADILVNNLGIFEPKPFEAITDADWYRFFDTNVMSGIRLSRHYLPLMVKRRWGRIVFISSESALNIPAEMIHYGMTKTAQLAIARGLAESVAGTGVTVNSVLPGPTRTEGVAEFIGSWPRTSTSPRSRWRRNSSPEPADLAAQTSGEPGGSGQYGSLCLLAAGLGHHRRGAPCRWRCGTLDRVSACARGVCSASTDNNGLARNHSPDAITMRLPLTGGCQCGGVRYEIKAEPLTLYVCHCTECQRQSGSAFALSLAVARDAVVVHGTPATWRRELESGRVIWCLFCGGCGAGSCTTRNAIRGPRSSSRGRSTTPNGSSRSGISGPAARSPGSTFRRTR